MYEAMYMVNMAKNIASIFAMFQCGVTFNIK